MIKFFSKLQQRFFYKHLAEIRAWDTRNWKAPAPHFIKQARLLEQGLANGTWVETGTFTGDTAFKLSEKAQHVYTVEPSEELYAAAQKKYSFVKNITSLHGTSESILTSLLPHCRGMCRFGLMGTTLAVRPF